ncbi:unnamed protein product [Lupinus luteus]|uniref:Uncharacterized protein n=1 Tax=Lupinus luteus TaxID=3873 RepID=A0AAV1XRW6_LUPLU
MKRENRETQTSTGAATAAADDDEVDLVFAKSKARTSSTTCKPTISSYAGTLKQPPSPSTTQHSAAA